MPPIFTSLLATRLSAKSALPVRECVSGEPLRPGSAVIAPGDFHMVVSQQDGLLVLKTNQGAKENYCAHPWMCFSTPSRLPSEHGLLLWFSPEWDETDASDAKGFAD